MSMQVNENNKMTISIIDVAANFGLGMVASLFTSANAIIGGSFLLLVSVIEKIVQPIFDGILKYIVSFAGAFIITNLVTKISLPSAIFIDVFGSLCCFAVIAAILAVVGLTAYNAQRQSQQLAACTAQRQNLQLGA